jgi:hypothetical protein
MAQHVAPLDRHFDGTNSWQIETKFRPAAECGTRASDIGTTVSERSPIDYPNQSLSIVIE